MIATTRPAAPKAIAKTFNVVLDELDLASLPLLAGTSLPEAVTLGPPLDAAVFAGAVSDELLLKIKDRFRAKLRVSPKIIFASIQEINRIKFPENSRKSITLFDHRTQR